jgi:DNA-directed RNA polymerase, beta subunit/140 kD subunit
MFLSKKFFSKFNWIEPKGLVEFQKERYFKFLNSKIADVFKEFFPIFDYSEKEFRIDFLGHSFGSPRISEEES